VEESLIFQPEKTRLVFDDAARAGRRLGVRVDLPVEISRRRSGPRRLPVCTQPWSHTYIKYDGLVHACCFSENLVMGDLNRESFGEIWNGRRYRQLRGRVNDSPPADCLKCEMRFRYSPSPDDYSTYIKLRPRKK
jgi:radical SAM protein with 4Fe4S-binding SPASM domain